MPTINLLDLRRASNWDPAHLTAEAFSWPGEGILLPLREAASSVVAHSFADGGAQVVVPQSIDGARGGIRKRVSNYQGPVFQVGRELRPGDTVVPRTPSGPAIHISAEHQGMLFSTRFLAFRPAIGQLSLWLWAVLSSESGQRWRESLSRGETVPMLDARFLLDSTVPLPSDLPSQTIEQLLQEANTTYTDEDEPVQTWWRTVELREHGWYLSLATPEPQQLDDGTPLGEWASEIRRGGNTRRGAVDAELPGYLPVADVSWLGGRPPRRWIPIEDAVIAEPGDLLVAAVGNLPHATLSEQPVAVDVDVLRVGLHRPVLAASLARYLNSRTGYGLRQILLTGAAVPHLSPSSLARLPVREESLEAPPSEPLAPLAARLEQVLWPR